MGTFVWKLAVSYMEEKNTRQAIFQELSPLCVRESTVSLHISWSTTISDKSWPIVLNRVYKNNSTEIGYYTGEIANTGKQEIEWPPHTHIHLHSYSLGCYHSISREPFQKFINNSDQVNAPQAMTMSNKNMNTWCYKDAIAGNTVTVSSLSPSV